MSPSGANCREVGKRGEIVEVITVPKGWPTRGRRLAVRTCGAPDALPVGQGPLSRSASFPVK